jgi:hypothetical protein
VALLYGIKSVPQNLLLDKEGRIPEKFAIRVGRVMQQPYGKEVNIIDIAGVCRHFVE